MARSRISAFFMIVIFAQFASADINTDFYAAVEARDMPAVVRLISSGADVSAVHIIGEFGDQGMMIVTKGTALIKAVQEQYIEIVEVLIGADAKLNVLTTRPSSFYKGRTALMTAALFASPECTKLLIDAGADLNFKDTDGHTALVHVIPETSQIKAEERDRRLAIGRLFLDANVDLNLRDNAGITPLMLAAQKGLGDFINLFADADLNAAEKYGRTALIMAADKGKTEAVKALIEIGADLNIEDRFGYTALGLAQDKGYKEIADMLTAAGAR